MKGLKTNRAFNLITQPNSKTVYSSLRREFATLKVVFPYDTYFPFNGVNDADDDDAWEIQHFSQCGPFNENSVNSGKKIKWNGKTRREICIHCAVVMVENTQKRRYSNQYFWSNGMCMYLSKRP